MLLYHDYTLNVHSGKPKVLRVKLTQAKLWPKASHVLARSS